MYYNLNQYMDFLARILAACICGFAIGFERENRHKFAGVRTHTIVALGASIAMLISKYGFSDVGGYDAARVAAQIVSGIGFLGAGVIFVKNNAVSGLTTAAGIWTTSIIGMAFGAGMYLIGIVSSAIILSLQTFFYRNELFNFHLRLNTVFVEAKNVETLHEVDRYTTEKNFEKKSYTLSYNDGKYMLNFKFICQDIEEKTNFINYLDEKEDIINFRIN